MSGEIKKIDFWDVMKDLNACYMEDGHVDLVAYLRGYRTLVRFFRLLGRLFSYIAYDTESKISILEKYLESENGERYQTAQSMVEFEKTSGLLTAKEPSGSRTLLRLHWAIEFIISFLEKIRYLKDDDKTYPACQDSYKATLARHHPWIIQKGAMIAMRTLPTAQVLAQQTCIQPIEELREALPKVIDLGHAVYRTIQKLYEDNELLDLP